MSHYTVGVIIKEKDIQRLEEKENIVFEEAVQELVDKAMNPFYEGLVVEGELIQTIEEIKEDHAKIISYDGDDEWHISMKEKYKDASLQEFCEGYHGYIYKEDGAYSTYNPNSKWDWYVIGGRWNGCLPIKNEEKPSEDLDAYEDDIPNNCCKIKDIELRREATEEEIVEMKETYQKITTEGNWYKPEYYKQKYPTFEVYMNSELQYATYALLTSNGEWIEPGEMGWFGISSATPEEEVEFVSTFKETLAKEDPEDYFVLVDCHI